MQTKKGNYQSFNKISDITKMKAVFTNSGKRFLLEISRKNRTVLSAINIPLPT